jgi:AraC family transcriptional regulator, regulatory protein of adaptative response / methylated-DNA-[protein]-cysteine methyltransferase
MPEMIRFAWGTSTLGDFMLAVSDKGLVAAEFSPGHGATEEALRARFPGAEVINKQHELIDCIEKVRQAI